MWLLFYIICKNKANLRLHCLQKKDKKDKVETETKNSETCVEHVGKKIGKINCRKSKIKANQKIQSELSKAQKLTIKVKNV
jgi:hypothetical protein